VGSGATTFGADFRRYPWTIGFRPSHRAEGLIYGSYVSRTRPGAKVAVLSQSDASGTERLAGLRQGLAGSKARVVAAQPVDATVPSVPAAQVASLKASGASVLALFAAQPQAAQAYALASRLGWRPLIVTGGAATVAGAVSITFVKDPTDTAWRNDAAMKLYRAIMATYAKGASPKDVNHVYGMAVAYETVKLLKAAGKTPTRAALIAQTRKLNDVSNPFLLPGIAVKTTPTERFPIEQALLQRWSKGRWTSFGGLWG
jgi:branched-chain amino acid transport system substrate-binding protein